MYNFSMTSLFEHIRDFLVCHYALTSREDSPYWVDISNNTKISDALREKLLLARAVLPDRQFQHIYDGALVSHGLTPFMLGIGWPCILLGMNFLPYETGADMARGGGNFEKHVVDNMQHANEFFANKRQRINQMLNELPSHYEYLRRHFYGGRE